jgi:hypothetical protein
MEKRIKDIKDEKWEVIQGGNFLQVWEAGRYATMTYLCFEDGKIADVALPNVYEEKGENYLNHKTVMARVMPRAHLIAAAPEMLRALEANHEWHLENDEYGGYEGSELWEMNLAAIKLARESAMPEPQVDLTKDQEISVTAEWNQASPENQITLIDPRDKAQEDETCLHGFGFVEYCPDCTSNNLLEAAENAALVWSSDSASVDPEEVHAMLVDAITAFKTARGKNNHV